MAAAQFCELLDKRDRMRKYKQTAQEIKDAALKYLFSEELDSFVRIAYQDPQGVLRQEQVVDASSLFGLWYFGMLEQSHPLFQKTLSQVRTRLRSPAKVGGYIRYERDEYFKDTDISNSWIITTLWEALRKLYKPEVTQHDLQYVEDVLNWVVEHRYNSGVLAEQLNPYTGESRSATPLVWSHAVYVETILKYIEKHAQLNSV